MERFAEPRLSRAFDLMAALAALVLLSPLFAAIAIVILCDSPGPVLFRQVRVGRDGRPFDILKFRTMVRDAASRGPSITVGGDPRRTRVGAWLRRSKLDELPQLVNVLRGDMSFVGPRPEVPEFVDAYTPAQRRVLEVRPGITDPASLLYINEEVLLALAPDWRKTYLDEIAPRKLALNLAYLGRRSFASDLGILAKTLVELVKARSR